MRNTRKSQCVGNFVGIECLNVVLFGDNTNGVGITKSVSHPSPLDAGALGISHAARAFSLSARRGGPCKAVGNQGVARLGPLFRLCPRPYKSKLLTALGINGISIALRC